MAIFKTVLISSRRRALRKNIGKYRNLKGKYILTISLLKIAYSQTNYI